MAASLQDQLKPLFTAGVNLKTGVFVRDVHRKAARPLKEAALKNVMRGIGADRQLRNFPRPGRKVKQYVRYDIAKRDTMTLAFVPAGMATIIEYPTRHAPIARPIAQTAKVAPRIWQAELVKHWNRTVR